MAEPTPERYVTGHGTVVEGMRYREPPTGGKDVSAERIAEWIASTPSDDYVTAHAGLQIRGGDGPRLVLDGMVVVLIERQFWPTHPGILKDAPRG